MRRILNWLARKRFPYQPLILVGISESRLIHNLNEFRKLIPSGQIAPVLKSNAYGHGLILVAKILSKEPNIPFFVVDSYFEAVTLRVKGIKTPLLVIGYNRPRTIIESTLNHTAFAITGIEALRELRDTNKSVHIHIKVDTGMHRQGIMPEEIAEAIAIVQENSHIKLEGICTHFADADNVDETFTEAQINTWKKAVEQFKAAFPAIRYIHSANTDGSRFSKSTPDNMMRLGIGLYGLTDNTALNKELDLKPVLEIDTLVTGLKHIKKGDIVGYSKTFTAAEDTTIATIPVGYFEFLDRRFSNNGFVQVGADKVVCPIIGRISMNITTIDVSKVTNPSIGMPVKVIGHDVTDPNSISSMAKRYGTITYELVVKIPLQLRRIVLN